MAVSRSGEFSSEGWIGRAVLRSEDPRLVTGRGRFVDDIRLDGALHLDFVRSAHPRGRIVGLDAEAARRAEGVVAVLTGADLADIGAIAINPLVDHLVPPPFAPLAHDSVEAVGHPVAAVVATSLAAARDAAQLVQLDIDPLPRRHMDDGEPPVYAQRHRAGEVEAAFAAAAHVVEVEVRHARLAPAPLEPRAALATWDAETATLTAWISTQTPHRARDDIARALGLAEDRVRVVAPDVGGAFGGKASIHPEDLVVAAAALRLGRPVKWCAARGEDFLAATQGRGGRLMGRMALDGEGRALALKADIVFPLGHWLPYSAVVPGRNAARVLPGPYRIDAVDIAVEGRMESAAALNIYRGAGRPEAAMLMERLMDAAARMTGLDPAEIRRRNLIGPADLPRPTPTGELLDTGDFPALLARAGERFGLEDARAEVAARRAAGELCGIGIGLYVEPCGQGWESATLELAPDGRIRAATGSTAQGQGRETAAAQIVADRLGLPLEAVEILHGDTATAPKGIGALASRSTAIGGSALAAAARDFREAARQAAARAIGCSPAHLAAMGTGFIALDGTGRSVSFAALAARGETLRTPIVHTPKGEAWGSGCVIALVGIEPETGVPTVERIVWADDAGTVVNPMLVEGQLVGGMAQGLGEALMEAVVYDADGQLLTGSLMDYRLPRAADIPPVTIDKLGVPSAMNELGAKGVGEAGTIGVPAAVFNAVADALAAQGIPPPDMPLTASKLWAALHSAGKDATRP